MSFPDLAMPTSVPPPGLSPGINAWAMPGDAIAFDTWWSHATQSSPPACLLLDHCLELLVHHGAVPYVGSLGSIDPHPQHATIARRLIAAGARPPRQALVAAASNNNLAMLDLLVSAGASLADDGGPALAVAVRAHHLDMARHLIHQYGQSLHVQPALRTHLIQHFHAEVCRCCLNAAHLDVVQAMLERAQAWRVQVDPNVLLNALSGLAGPRRTVPDTSNTPSRTVTLACWLLAQGANPMSMVQGDPAWGIDVSTTALERSAAGGQVDLLDLFATRPNGLTAHLPTLMRTAALHGRPHVLHHLVNHHGATWCMLDEHSRHHLGTALAHQVFESVRAGDVPAIRSLLQTARNAQAPMDLEDPLAMVLRLRRIDLAGLLAQNASLDDLTTAMPHAMTLNVPELRQRWSTLSPCPTVPPGWAVVAVAHDQVDNLIWAVAHGIDLRQHGEALRSQAITSRAHRVALWLDQAIERQALNDTLEGLDEPRATDGRTRRRL